MSDIKNWSRTDAANTDSTNSGMPEGMARSDVNDRIREHLGAIRRFYEDAEWVDIVSEHKGDFTLSRVDASTFRVANVAGGGTDARSRFLDGTWVKLTFASSGVIYGSIDGDPSYSAPNTDVDLTEIVNAAYATTTLPAEAINSAEVYSGRRIRSAAFSKIGTTTSETPQQIPTIDLLDPHVLKSEGAGGGINADQLDGEHKLYFENRDLEVHQSVLSNGDFTTWAEPTVNGESDPDNADGNACATDWVIVYDSTDSFDYARIVAGYSATAAENIPNFVWSLQMLANFTNRKGGIVQVVSELDSRPIVQNGKACLSFYARTATGDSISRANCAIYYSLVHAATPPVDVVASWNVEGTKPTPKTEWTEAGVSASVFAITDTWTRFQIEDVTIPETAIKLAALIWIDQVTTLYGTADLFFVAGAQLETGTEISTFRHKL